MPSISNHKNKEIGKVVISRTNSDGKENTFSDGSNRINRHTISNHKNKEIGNVFISKTNNDGGEKVFSGDTNHLNMPSISNHQYKKKHQKDKKTYVERAFLAHTVLAPITVALYQWGLP